jgi:glycosyltransferase involved in cell wall biosynthesis
VPGEAEIDVSVVIPTFNRLWSLPRAIDSCRGTSCKTEIIVVDDGSTDGTFEWLRSQGDIKSFYQTNQGQTYAINLGVCHATGKYIRFLDSDDFLAEGTIDKQFVAAEKHGAELVYSGVDIFDEETKAVTKSPQIGAWDDFMEVQLGNSYGSHFLGMLFKTEWVKEIPRRPDFAFREDRMFLLEYALREPKTVWVEGCAGYWVKHTDQMQANYRGLKSQVTNWQHLNIYKRILAELDKTGRLTQARKNAACTVLWPIAHWIAIDHPGEAAAVVDWIYELNPEFKIPETGLLGFMYRKLSFKTTEKLLRLRRFLKYKWQ